MSKPDLWSAWHYLCSRADTNGGERLSDLQLLERFLHYREDAAFIVLVQRHSRLILSAIRRVLSDEADVEDAFQATFLVLLRRASSVRWHESIGNWLFGVAHRIAVRTAAKASRRRRRESEASRERPRAEDVSAHLSWREALGLLHEELDRLPDKYRLPLLLCYLEGKGREEAARALGCSVNAIKWRLERGRMLLRKRLMRRGVATSGVLLAAAVYAPAAKAATPALVQATLNAAKSEAFPASMDALRKAAKPSPSSSKVRRAVYVLLAAILLVVAAGATLASRRAAPQEPADPETQSRLPLLPAPADATETVILRGRVLDPDGKALNGAQLFSPHFENFSPTGGGNILLVSLGISDAEGRFRVEFPRSDIPRGGIASFLAAADGYGVSLVDWPVGPSSLELILRLARNTPSRGRILNPEGAPVAVQIFALYNALPRQTASSTPSSMPGAKAGNLPRGKPLPACLFREMSSGTPPILIRTVATPSTK